MKNNTLSNAIQDGGMRNLVGAFIDGKTVGSDDKAARGVPNFDQAIVTLVQKHKLDFDWTTENAATGTGAQYTLKESSIPKAQVLLGTGKIVFAA